MNNYNLPLQEVTEAYIESNGSSCSGVRVLKQFLIISECSEEDGLTN